MVVIRLARGGSKSAHFIHLWQLILKCDAMVALSSV